MKRLTKEEFISRAQAIHGNKFSYDKVIYLGERIKVKIVCPIHGTYQQLPKNHTTHKQGCPSCYGNKKLTNDEFIAKANLIHFNKYDYSNVSYSGNKGKVKIICVEHGLFMQSATRHLSGDGCPKCSESKGERKIRQFLERKNICFERQKRFDGCRDKNLLSYDFFIPIKNVLIEYDGMQHFKKSKGKVFDYEKIKLHDQIKSDYAENNGYGLIRIPYTKLNNIENILNAII